MVTADKSFQLYACKYISAQLKKLCSQIDGARIQKEVECVHQSRVASRRMRVAFEIFQTCFPEKTVNKWEKDIKSLTKGLGTARDVDVQIIALNEIISKLDAEQRSLKPGIERLLLRSSQKRNSLQQSVIKAIDKLESRTVLADIHSTVERTLFCLRNENKQYKSDYLFRTFKKHVSDRAERLCSFNSCMNDPDDKPAHHQMRIEGKKLRYALEICADAYDGKLDDEFKVVKKIQSLLGDIHDCDVWAERIDGFMADELQRTREYFGNEVPYYLLLPGLEHLRKYYDGRRRVLFEELSAYWARIAEDKVWDKLLGKLNDPLEIAIKARPEIIEIKDTRQTPPYGSNTQNSLALRGYPRESAGTEGGGI